MVVHDSSNLGVQLAIGTDVVQVASNNAPAVEHLYQLGRFAITKLYNAPADQISRYDVAEMNLISAFGLPGTQDMDMGAMLALLDEWARRVAIFTLKSMRIYHTRRADFDSLAQFRMAAMLHCLTREIGISYNPERITDPDNFIDPADSFIHGLLGPKRTGTCASLPILLVAIGRRLAYPLKIVLAPAHCFCRWDSSEERFNIEFHEQGLNSHPDEHYTEWPFKWPPELHERERARPMHLVSLTPPQELAYCAHTRASQLSIAGRHREAMATAEVAYRLWPNHSFGVWVTHLTTRAMYPDRDWPDIPCEETAGPIAFQRLLRHKGVVVLSELRR